MMKWMVNPPVPMTMPTPTAPMRYPTANNAISSKISARPTITAPSDGNVSSPANGGATNAPKANTKIIKPTTRNVTLLFIRLLIRGLEKRSNQRVRRIIRGTILPCSVLPKGMCCHFFGSHMVRRPAISSIASSMTISSKICVIPPVGSGNAGRNISITTTTAKLFSAKTLVSESIVLGPLLLSQASSLSLNGCIDYILDYKRSKVQIHA